MSVLYLLVPLALLFSALATLAFAWAARKGQFDDLVTPAVRVLHDDDGVSRAVTVVPSGSAAGSASATKVAPTTVFPALQGPSGLIPGRSSRSAVLADRT